jgi:hypothetical protein
MVINSTNINTTNLSSELNSLNTQRSLRMTFEIQILAWDRHKHVVGLNRLMESHSYWKCSDGYFNRISIACYPFYTNWFLILGWLFGIHIFWLSSYPQSQYWYITRYYILLKKTYTKGYKTETVCQVLLQWYAML